MSLFKSLRKKREKNPDSMENIKDQAKGTPLAQKLFAAEWSKSLEAQITGAFQNYDEGIKFAAVLLNTTYGLAKLDKDKVLSPTAEVLAMANILKRIKVTRDTIQSIYPHPKEKGAVLVEKKDGCTFEIFSKNKVACKRIDAKDPVLDFWHADDQILFPNENNFYL